MTCARMAVVWLCRVLQGAAASLELNEHSKQDCLVRVGVEKETQHSDILLITSLYSSQPSLCLLHVAAPGKREVT